MSDSAEIRASEMESLARKFLDECAEIESLIRSRNHIGEGGRGFGDLLIAARKKDPVIRRYGGGARRLSGASECFVP